MEKFADKIFIRRARQDDANLISALAATTFYETYYELDNPPDLADYIAKNFHPGAIQTELATPASTFFISYLNEKAIGYAKLRAESKAECITATQTIELQRIYLLQKMLGKGFGEKLLRHCLAEAAQKGYQSIWLSVWEHNLSAQKFYTKQGFTHAGETQFHYGSGFATNFVMEKTL